MSDATNIAKVAITAQAVGLLRDNLRKKRRPFAKQAVRNIFGVSLIAAESNILGA